MGWFILEESLDDMTSSFESFYIPLLQLPLSQLRGSEALHQSSPGRIRIGLGSIPKILGFWITSNRLGRILHLKAKYNLKGKGLKNAKLTAEYI